MHRGDLAQNIRIENEQTLNKTNVRAKVQLSRCFFWLHTGCTTLDHTVIQLNDVSLKTAILLASVFSVGSLGFQD